MWTKVLGAIALTGVLAVGTSIWAGMSGVKVTPLKPNKDLPTFASVQQQVGTYHPNAQTASSDAKPWAGAERNGRNLRDRARQEAMRSLTEKRGRACETDPNERLASGLGYYLEHRSRQERNYAKSWGPEGAKFISDAWATPDDRKVEELMREAYVAGDFTLDEVKASRGLAERVVGKAKPAKIRC